ncbi:MAG TPA: HAD-IA family hydrolase [Gaiellaceae bacterium]|nr:HAD-IA family hydrolase [Gaiellaceae bacterium]
MRAVIFDLWDTLVEWPVAEADVLRDRLATLAGAGEDEFARRWEDSYRATQIGPLAEVYRRIGVPEEHVEREIAARHDFGRRALRPRPGALAVLAKLRDRGLRLGLMSACSEEVPAVWPETELAGLFDTETFSASCGLMKPDPEMYHHTAEALGVEPSGCLFVGDGANDELGGAARVGMTPVLYVPRAEPFWPSLAGWDGLRISTLEQVLELF